jgi:hypothetical protein
MEEEEERKEEGEEEEEKKKIHFRTHDTIIAPLCP